MHIPHYRPSTPELERRRNAWLELFKTEDDLETFIFLFFKNSKELSKHGGGPISLRFIGSKLQITQEYKITIYSLKTQKQYLCNMIENDEILTLFSLTFSSLTFSSLKLA